METLISAVQKLVIKDVVMYSQRKVGAMRGAVGNQIINLNISYET